MPLAEEVKEISLKRLKVFEIKAARNVLLTNIEPIGNIRPSDTEVVYYASRARFDVLLELRRNLFVLTCSLTNCDAIRRAVCLILCSIASLTLAEVSSVGPIPATELVASAGTAEGFSSGRQLAV